MAEATARGTDHKRARTDMGKSEEVLKGVTMVESWIDVATAEQLTQRFNGLTKQIAGMRSGGTATKVRVSE